MCVCFCQVIRDLVSGDNHRKYVIVVEHDLAVLDYIGEARLLHEAQVVHTWCCYTNHTMLELPLASLRTVWLDMPCAIPGFVHLKLGHALPITATLIRFGLRQKRLICLVVVLCPS